MFLRQITDASLAQNAYLIGCQRTGEAVVVDPERDVDRYLKVAAENGLRITAVAETHIHADYLSGARELMERHGALAYLSSEGGPDWQFEWAKGHAKARFIRGGDSFHVGNIELKAVLSPGHTPEHLSFLVTDHGGGATEPMAFLTGDFIFVGDVGRPDLLESAAGQAGAMEPSARTLYESLRATAGLPEYLQILPAHGAGSACGKALGAVPGSVLGYERRFNPAFRLALEGGGDEFVREILSGQPEPPRYFARMKRDNKRGPALLRGGQVPRPRRLTVAELPAFLASGGIPLDLRGDRRAFMKRHLAGSLFAPFGGGRLSEAAGSYLDEATPVLLIVPDESVVEEATRQLIRIGQDQVAGWITEGEALGPQAEAAGLIRHQATIPASALAEALATHPGASVLDVRGAGEFAESHGAGAVNVAHTRLAARLEDLPSGRPLYVHCGSGLRAALAVPFLASRLKDVIHVDGAFGDIAAGVNPPVPPFP